MSFSKALPARALDAMVLVYALLEGHPAAPACEEFIRQRSGWFTTAVTLLETKAVLTKVYGVESAQTTQKLTQVASGPLLILPVDATIVAAAMARADELQVDLTDAVLLETAMAQGVAHLVTEDTRLAAASRRLGITPEQPFDDVLRQEIAIWESVHLPAKGLPRILARIHRWLKQRDSAVAQHFYSQTGGYSHLP